MMWRPKDSTDITPKPAEEYPVFRVPVKDEEVQNGLLFQETFQRGNINCISTYAITSTLPIKIKRT